MLHLTILAIFVVHHITYLIAYRSFPRLILFIIPLDYHHFTQFLSVHVDARVHV